MKEKIRSFLVSPLVKGSFWLALASLMSNLFNYFYNLAVGRSLGPSLYGAFGSLIALYAIIIVLASGVQIVSAKHTSRFMIGKRGKIHSLFVMLNKKMALVGLVVFVLFFALSPLISRFLKFPNQLPVMLLSFTFLIAFLSPVARGILQGLQKFFFLSLISTLETGIKFFSALILLALGFSLNGAIFALIMGMFIAYAAVFFPLRKMLSQTKDSTELETKEIKEDTLAVTLFYLGSTLLITLNIIMVKYYFPSLEAGLFVSISTLSLIIYYLSSAIVTVSLPQISQKFHGGGDHLKILKEAVVLALLIGILITSFYFLIPGGIIKIFYGQQYLLAAPYLGLYALSIIFYSLAQLLVTYFFAIQKNRPAYLPFLASLIFFSLLLLFHQNLWQIISISLIVNFLLFLTLLIFLLVQVKKDRKKIA